MYSITCRLEEIESVEKPAGKSLPKLKNPTTLSIIREHGRIKIHVVHVLLHVRMHTYVLCDKYHVRIVLSVQYCTISWQYTVNIVEHFICSVMCAQPGQESTALHD